MNVRQLFWGFPNAVDTRAYCRAELDFRRRNAVLVRARDFSRWANVVTVEEWLAIRGAGMAVSANAVIPWQEPMCEGRELRAP